MNAISLMQANMKKSKQDISNMAEKSEGVSKDTSVKNISEQNLTLMKQVKNLETRMSQLLSQKNELKQSQISQEINQLVNEIKDENTSSDS